MLCRVAAGEDNLEIVMEEVKRGAKRLKMKKAPGICGVIPEMLNAETGRPFRLDKEKAGELEVQRDRPRMRWLDNFK